MSRSPALQTVSLSVILLSFGIIACRSPAVDKSTPLVSGPDLFRSPAPGKKERFYATLAAGEILHLRVEQRGIDVILHFPNGELPPIDLLYGKYFPEEIWWLAENNERLEIEITALAGSGEFRLAVEKLGPAEPRDRRRFEAFRIATRPSSRDEERDEERSTNLEASIELWRGSQMPVQHALALAELGKTRDRLRHHDVAIAAFSDAIVLIESTPELALEGRFYRERGRVFYTTQRFDQAAADYQKARQLADEAEDSFAQGIAINDIAVLHFVRGELEAARENFELARSILAPSEPSRAHALVQLNLGRSYTLLGRLPEALPTLLAALRIAEQIDADDITAKVLREVGWWHRLDHQPDTARDYLLRALDLAPQDAGVLDRLGTVYADLGKLDEARSYFLQSLRETQGKNRLGEANVRANLCWLEELAGRFSEGLEQCRQALDVLDDLEAMGTAAEVFLLSAGLEHRRGGLVEAEEFAGEAVRRIESQRPLVKDPEIRTAFFAERLEAHQLLIRLRMELHELEREVGWDLKALQVSELTQARGLLDMLSAERVDPARGVASSLERREAKLLDEIDRRTGDLVALRRPDAEVSEEELSSVRRDLVALEARLFEIRVELRHAAPSYTALIQPEALDIARIQELLDDETLLLEYHLGKEESYLWGISRDEVRSYELAKRDRLEGLAKSLYQLLSNPQLRWAGGPVRRQSIRMSRHLLGPIAEDLSRWRRLVIVADGGLRRLPFGALPLPSETSDARPLITEHEIVILPSAAVLTVLQQQTNGRPVAAGLLAVMADPVYAMSDPRLDAPHEALPGGELYPRLLGTAEEASDLMDLADFGETLLLEGFEARRDRILAGDFENYRIVHFATHAETEGDLLGLLLSRFDAGGDPLKEQGILGLRDLYGLDLPAELVVLSACDTALGEEIRGEGLVGLTRGFMHAGTPRVVVSLWPVQDRPTRDLMRRYYEALLHGGVGPAEALRQAQVSMWHDGHSAYYWAAFVHQGDWRPFPMTVTP